MGKGCTPVRRYTVITYIEYIKGELQYYDRIAMAPLYGQLDENAYYPVIPLRTEDEQIEVAEILKLPVQECLVYAKPGETPQQIALYIDDFCAYALRIVEDPE